MQMKISEARRRWSRAQGLDRRFGADLAGAVAETGWIRTLGGAEAYLGLAARSGHATVDSIHGAVAARSLRVSPAARGCIFVIPESDAALALRLADRLSASRNARDLEKAGVEDGELAVLGDAVVEALTGGPLSTGDVRKALPKDAIRSLGERGKKIGITSTLPPTLRALEFAGRVRRRPLEDRLDHERYTWVASEPLDGPPAEDPQWLIDLAQRYFKWAGPATRDAFAAWSGLGKRDAQSAIEGAGLVAVEVEGLGGAWLSDETSADAPEPLAFLPGLDNLFGLQLTGAPLVDPRWHAVLIASFGRASTVPIGEVSQPMDRVIAEDGEVVGLWAWDVDAHDFVTHRFDGGVVPLDRSGARAARTILAELGHGRVTVLDKASHVAARVARIRNL